MRDSYCAQQIITQSQIVIPALHFVRTGSCTVHYYETMNGLRLALYTSNDTPYHSVSTSSLTTSLSSNKLSTMATTGGGGSGTTLLNTTGDGIAGTRDALRYIYVELWVDSVIRCPSYRPGKPDAVAATNFEKRLDSYLLSLPWFR
jgi:hypothetical protein